VPKLHAMAAYYGIVKFPHNIKFCGNLWCDEKVTWVGIMSHTSARRKLFKTIILFFSANNELEKVVGWHKPNLTLYIYLFI
jgi:hypothetical protein